MFGTLNCGFSVLLYCDPVCLLRGEGLTMFLDNSKHNVAMFNVYSNGPFTLYGLGQWDTDCLMFWKETYSQACGGMWGRVQVCVN